MKSLMFSRGLRFFYLWSCFQPLQIKSAVAVEGLKGYIYIEAYKQTHVKQVPTA